MSDTARLEAEAGTIAARPAPGAMLAAMAVPYYPRLWAIGLLVSLTRWMTIFTCSYLVNDLTHSALLVQLVGAAIFAPMFFGGAMAGVVSDRINRKYAQAVMLGLLAPAAVLVALADISGQLEVWMVYPFVLAVGMNHAIDMTSRRALVYDFVGPANINNALALESLAMTTGGLVGNLGAGSVIAGLGIGPAFLVVAALYCSALLILGTLPAITRQTKDDGRSFLKELAAGFSYVRGQPALVSVLGVTVIMNLFYFSFVPLVPVFGEQLGVGAFLTGLLSSAHAVGSVVGAAFIAKGLRLGRGRTYIGGSVFALVFLCIFAAAGWYPAALIALLIAGVGIAGFATMQSVLVMVSSTDEMRGRAMGILSMSIGVLPVSMLMLGGAAQAFDPSAGVIGSVVVGLVVMAVWLLRRPEAIRLD